MLIHKIEGDNTANYSVPINTDGYNYFCLHNNKKVEIIGTVIREGFFDVTLEKAIPHGDIVEFYALVDNFAISESDTLDFTAGAEKILCKLKFLESSATADDKTILSLVYKAVKLLEENDGLILINEPAHTQELQDIESVLNYVDQFGVSETVSGRFIIITNPFVLDVIVDENMGYTTKMVDTLFSIFFASSQKSLSKKDIRPLYVNPKYNTANPVSLDHDLNLNDVNEFYLKEPNKTINRYQGALRPVLLNFNPGETLQIELYLPIDLDIVLYPLAVIGTVTGDMWHKTKLDAIIDGKRMYKTIYTQRYPTADVSYTEVYGWSLRQ